MQNPLRKWFFVIEVEVVKPGDFTKVSIFKKFCKGGGFRGCYSRGQSLRGYLARPIQSSSQASTEGPSLTILYFFELEGYLQTFSSSQKTYT